MLAKDITDEFPDPNPLASIFHPYIVDEIVEYVKNYNKVTE
jgi:hypothetical protein